MRNSVKPLKRLINECSDTSRREWTDEARTILEAVRGTRRPTKWKVRRTIAEAILKKIVVPSLADSGWQLSTAQADGPGCDVLLERDVAVARIEIVLLQPVTARFKRIYREQQSDGEYVLEMQRKAPQTAVKVAAKARSRQTASVSAAMGRCYRFGEFDILAVNTHAVGRIWTDFRYTLSTSLLPHSADPSHINPVQSVPLRPDDIWTDDLGVCLEWFSRTNQGAAAPHRK